MQYLEAYQARKIIIYIAQKNLDHWKLIVNVFQKDLAKSVFAANHLLSCNIKLDSNSNIFTITEEPLSLGFMPIGSEYQLQQKYTNNVIYALAQNIIKSLEDTKDIQKIVYESFKKNFKYQQDFIRLINTFLKEKYQKQTLTKFINKITDSKVKTEEQKTASIANKFSKLTETLDNLLIDFHGKYDETKKNIDEHIDIIKDCSFSLFLQLLEEQDEPTNRDLPFILRKILEINGTNNKSTLDIIDPNLDIYYKYKPEDLDKVKMICNLIRQISENIKTQYQKIKVEEHRFFEYFSRSLKEKYKLILSAIKTLKIYKIHNPFAEDLKTSLEQQNNKQIFILHQYNNKTVEFNMPMINLQKIGIYKDSFFSSVNHIPTLEFNAIDIGNNKIDDEVIYNFFKFIETGEINNVTLKDFIYLNELFDYFIIDAKIQRDILNNYLLQYLQSNECEFILNQIQSHLNINYTTGNNPLTFRALDPIVDLNKFNHNLFELTKADKLRIGF